MTLLWSLRGSKVLIVDDLPDMRTAVRDLVYSLGCEDIQAARDGDQAIRSMAATPFDVVLCDYNMGEGKDGQQVLEEALYRGLLPVGACFVMLTAEHAMSMVTAAVECMPDDYLSKPIPRGVFQLRLRKAMEKKARFVPLLKAVKAKDYEEALRLCEHFLAIYPAHRMDIWKIRGEALLEQGMLWQAAALYQQIWELREIAWAAVGLAKALFGQGQYEASADVLQTLLDKQPLCMAAYDGLAQAWLALGRPADAQAVLSKAVKYSPKSLLRQKRLGDLAYGNGDFAAAEEAYQQAVRIGKNSCFRGPAEFAGLAKAQAQRGYGERALKTLALLEREFRGDRLAQWLAASMEAIIHHGMGHAEKAAAAIASAMEWFQAQPEAADEETVMELAALCLAVGQTEQAKTLLHEVLARQAADAEGSEKVQALCRQAGMDAASKN